jgi:hypothetical protein
MDEKWKQTNRLCLEKIMMNKKVRANKRKKRRKKTKAELKGRRRKKME